jgi:hypothetical protein
MSRTLPMLATLVLALATTSLATAQDTSGGAQPNRQPSQSIAQPTSPSPSESTGNDVTRETTWDSAPVNTNSYISPAAPIPQGATTEEQKQPAAARQDDPNKSPWWAPRDWSYINNEAP